MLDFFKETVIIGLGDYTTEDIGKMSSAIERLRQFGEVTSMTEISPEYLALEGLGLAFVVRGGMRNGNKISLTPKGQSIQLFQEYHRAKRPGDSPEFPTSKPLASIEMEDITFLHIMEIELLDNLLNEMRGDDSHWTSVEVTLERLIAAAPARMGSKVTFIEFAKKYLLDNGLTITNNYSNGDGQMITLKGEKFDSFRLEQQRQLKTREDLSKGTPYTEQMRITSEKLLSFVEGQIPTLKEKVTDFSAKTREERIGLMTEIERLADHCRTYAKSWCKSYANPTWYHENFKPDGRETSFSLDDIKTNIKNVLNIDLDGLRLRFTPVSKRLFDLRDFLVDELSILLDVAEFQREAEIIQRFGQREALSPMPKEIVVSRLRGQYAVMNEDDVPEWQTPPHMIIEADILYMFNLLTAYDTIERDARSVIRQLELKANHIGSSSSPEVIPYVNQDRIRELRSLSGKKFDTLRLVKSCEELNKCYRDGSYLAVTLLVRALMDHIPPIFGKTNFAGVYSQHTVRSFREQMEHLDKSARKIADGYTHNQITSKEGLPNPTQVNFAQSLDVLLQEICKELSNPSTPSGTQSEKQKEKADVPKNTKGQNDLLKELIAIHKESVQTTQQIYEKETKRKAREKMMENMPNFVVIRSAMNQRDFSWYLTNEGKRAKFIRLINPGLNEHVFLNSPDANIWIENGKDLLVTGTTKNPSRMANSVDHSLIIEFQDGVGTLYHQIFEFSNGRLFKAHEMTEIEQSPQPVES